MGLIEILSLVILAVGFAIVYTAKFIVDKLKLEERQKCGHESEMTEDEVKAYKHNKAVLSVKIAGLVVSIPGIILFIIGFRQ